jgi:Family of unknown function (DUF5681)
MTEGIDEPIGYKHPPKSTQFQKGKSGNNRGRPVGRKNVIPNDGILSQMVTIRQNGIERQVTNAEAFLLKIVHDGITGGAGANKEAWATVEQAQLGLKRQRLRQRVQLVIRFVAPGNPNFVLERLRMVRVLDCYRATARTVIEPWVVQACLNGLGPKRLSVEEQREVYKATRTPRKVKWPEWWAVPTD